MPRHSLFAMAQAGRAAARPRRRLRVAWPLLLLRGSHGDSLAVDLPPRFDVRITAVGTGADAGKYGWQHIVGVAGGAWVDASGSGTLSRDPLFEYNAFGNLAVGDRVEVKREVGSGELRSQAEYCR